MSRAVKGLIVALVFFVAGAIVAGTGFALGGAEVLFAFDDAEYETHEVTVDETFTSIEIDCVIDNITVRRSENDTCTVVYCEPSEVTHEIEVEGDTLVISAEDDRVYMLPFDLESEHPYVELYLPGDEYDRLFINVSEGSIELDELNIGSLRIDCSAGEIELQNVIAFEIIELDLDVGDVKLNACDAPLIRITNDMGDVTGTLLTNKTFEAHTDMGDVDVPSGGGDGVCEIDVDTGNISIDIAGA
ncbi:MAG: DUF4097 family beta strand repeat protein [Clostridiales bacterium]|nr:DUF4097 family beta strand repeat protein [Clostridiales bacterium]